MSVAEPVLADPWQMCFDSLGQLPAEVLHELDAAWQSLDDYQAQLERWHQELAAEHARLATSSQAAPPPMAAVAPAPVTPAQQAPPERSLSAAARQFATLRRQCSTNRQSA